MIHARRTNSASSGQMVLAAALILLMLLLSVPMMVLINQRGGSHQTASGNRIKGSASADQALSVASYILGNSGSALANKTHRQVWQTMLTAPNTTATFGIAGQCGNGVPGPIQKTPDGQQFTLLCRNINTPGAPDNLQPFQMDVIATAYGQDLNGKLTPLRSVEGFISARTVSVALNSGLRASVALGLVNVPNLNGHTLTVDWGPIASFDTTGPLNLGVLPLSPRIFSRNGIVGAPLSATDPSTDQQQLWANMDLGFNPVVDLAQYYTYASYTTVSPAPGYSCPGLPPSDGVLCATANCAIYLDGGGCKPIFANGYTLTSMHVPPYPPVIICHGGAIFNNLGIDMGLDSAFIVEGKGLFQDNSGVGIPDYAISIPTSAELEYLKGGVPPCNAATNFGKRGATCTRVATGATHPLNFHGFMWLKGGMDVQPTAPTPNDWYFHGVLLVGDRATPNAAANLTMTNPAPAFRILYDDQVNRKILVGNSSTPLPGDPVELQVDFRRDVPTVGS